jgi:phosphopantetheinyl transferase (holo-ACP synthase)
MTSSRWTSSFSLPVRWFGVDAEEVGRFGRIAAEEGHPMPFVFSAKEIYFQRSLLSPALGLCASFCCKEAVFKALGTPYNFCECELLYKPGSLSTPIHFHERLKQELGVAEGVAVVEVGTGPADEIVVAAYLS